MKLPLSLSIPLAGVFMALPSNAQVEEPVPTELEEASIVAEDDKPLSFLEALRGGEVWLDLRYRFEFVDQDGIDKDAYASTLRTVLGYRTGEFHKFRGLVEFFNVSSVGDDLYNSTANGNVDRPVVADPTGSQVNRAQLEFAANEHNDLIAGRQRINLDNQRFVGAVDWRQNQQTFDSFSYSGHDIGGFDLFYGYLDNVNTVLRTNSPMSSHLANAKYDFGDIGSLGAYAYILDFKDLNALSTNTFGGAFTGKPALNEDWSLNYRAEYATQVDGGDNPNNVDADYAHLVLGGKYRQARLDFGYELLGGSGVLGESFQTPLATGHKFNGWADKFLSTPPGGLQDVYVRLGYDVGATGLAAIWHNFEADAGSADYGTELDLLGTHDLGDGLVLGLKFAYYDADTFLTDTTKAWAWLKFSF